MSKTKKILVITIVVICLSICLSISACAIDIMQSFSPNLYLIYNNGANQYTLSLNEASPALTIGNADRVDILAYQNNSFNVNGGKFVVDFEFIVKGNTTAYSWNFGRSVLYIARSGDVPYTDNLNTSPYRYSCTQKYEANSIFDGYTGITRYNVSVTVENVNFNVSGLAVRLKPSSPFGSATKLGFTGFSFNYYSDADYATIYNLDNEKSEARQSSNGALDSASEAVPDKSTGFLAPYQTLVNSMSYSGTDCELQFPSIYVPAIGDVLPDEIPLLTSQTIDFSAAIDCIPSSILSLIRAVFDVVLVIFCGKEFYSLLYGLFSGYQKGDDS